MPWRPELSVGVTLIDDQHKLWFEKAEKLFEEGKKGTAKAYVGELLEFLTAYTKKHFADEESYMRKINYPHYEQQRQAHADFIRKLDQLKKDYDSSGGNISVIIAANTMVINWLTQHISTMDKEIGAYAASL